MKTYEELKREKNERALEKQKKCLADAVLARDRKELIEKLVEHSREVQGAGNARLVKLYWLGRTLCKMYFSYDKALNQYKDEDFIEIARRIKNDSRWSADTKLDYYRTLKSVITLLGKEVPQAVKDMKFTKRDTGEEINVHNVLWPSDIRKLYESLDNVRDELIILFLWETGARISEILKMEKRDVYGFEGEGYKVRVPKTKTKERELTLVASKPLMLEWLDMHPLKNEDAPLFVQLTGAYRGRRLTQSGFNGVVRTAFANVGWADVKTSGTGNARRRSVKVLTDKRMNLHWFRKSRACWLAAQGGITQAKLNYIMGWKQGTKTAAVYMRLFGEGVEEEMLGMWGRESKRGTRNGERGYLDAGPLEVQVCFNCGFESPAHLSKCSKCFEPLSSSSFIELQLKREEKERQLAEMNKLFIHLNKFKHSELSMKEVLDEYKKLVKEVGK